MEATVEQQNAYRMVRPKLAEIFNRELRQEEQYAVRGYPDRLFALSRHEQLQGRIALLKELVTLIDKEMGIQ